MSASKGERSGETTGETAARLLAIHDQIGHVDDDLRQPDAIPLARAWLEHWAELLLDSPRSAGGPLASLITDVRRSERAVVRSSSLRRIREDFAGVRFDPTSVDAFEWGRFMAFKRVIEVLTDEDSASNEEATTPITLASSYSRLALMARSEAWPADEKDRVIVARSIRLILDRLNAADPIIPDRLDAADTTEERFIVRYRDRAGFLRERDDLDGVSLVGLDPGPTVYSGRERAEAARLRALDHLEHDAEVAALLVVVPHPASVAPAPTPAPTPAVKPSKSKPSKPRKPSRKARARA